MSSKEVFRFNFVDFSWNDQLIILIQQIKNISFINEMTEKVNIFFVFIFSKIFIFFKRNFFHFFHLFFYFLLVFKWNQFTIFSNYRDYISFFLKVLKKKKNDKKKIKKIKNKKQKIKIQKIPSERVLKKGTSLC